jgi:hypothetical protein
VGNGVHDDTAAILLAKAASVAANGVLYFPTGTYKTTAVIPITNGLHISGPSQSAIYPPTTTCAAMITNSASDLFTMGGDAQGVTMENICLQSTTAAGAGHILNLNGGTLSKSVFQGVNFYQWNAGKSAVVSAQTGIGSVTAVSGGSGFSGSGTIFLTNFNNNGTGATATVTLAGGVFSSAVVTNAGSGFTLNPTTATCTSGTATCTGSPVTITVATTTVGPQITGVTFRDDLFFDAAANAVPLIDLYNTSVNDVLFTGGWVQMQPTSTNYAFRIGSTASGVSAQNNRIDNLPIEQCLGGCISYIQTVNSSIANVTVSDIYGGTVVAPLISLNNYVGDTLDNVFSQGGNATYPDLYLSPSSAFTVTVKDSNLLYVGSTGNTGATFSSINNTIYHRTWVGEMALGSYGGSPGMTWNFTSTLDNTSNITMTSGTYNSYLGTIQVAQNGVLMGTIGGGGNGGWYLSTDHYGIHGFNVDTQNEIAKLGSDYVSDQSFQVNSASGSTRYFGTGPFGTSFLHVNTTVPIYGSANPNWTIWNTSAQANARNWAGTVNCPGGAFGDYCLMESTAKGGDPIAAGTVRGYWSYYGGLSVGHMIAMAAGVVSANTSLNIGSTVIADGSAHVAAQGGTTILYRCTVAGTLRVGQVTSVSADCGTAVDTGFRSN